jgi:glycosyltransferase involved in cell wall biosynthesis/SAM-dependent methyltransferase
VTHKLDFVLAVPGLPFNGETVAKQSLGGSETAGYYIARELAALGHRVTMFTNGEPGLWDDVQYLSLDNWRQYIAFTGHDVSIVQRSPMMFAPKLASKLNWLWCHDLALKRSETELKSVLWNVDRVLVLSEFMRKQYQEVTGLPDELMMVTRNGVDLALVQAARNEEQQRREHGEPSCPVNRRRLVYAARPERGLDVLLTKVMPAILQRVPDAKLALCTYDNQVGHLDEFYADCIAAQRALGPEVVENYGFLAKSDLYRLYQCSGVYVYPTPSPVSPNFAEVSCISAMEAMACGLPLVASNRGALKETIGGPAGKMVGAEGFGPLSDKDIAEFVDKTVLLLTDERARCYASESGLKRARQLDWKSVAEEWAEQAERQIRDKSGDRVSLAWHLYRRSDIVALRKLLDDESKAPAQNDAGLQPLRQIVETDYAFMVEPDGYKNQYEKIGATHDDRVVDWSVAESRFKQLGLWLKDHKEDITTVLDYGCAHGAYATNLCKALPHLQVLGVDIDSHGVELGGRFAEKLGVSDRCKFVVATHEDLPHRDPYFPRADEADDPHAKFDCVIAQEVLEHVPEPWKVIESLQQRVRPGGWVYLTVPFGPWEYQSYHTYPHRAHIWELDVHDWREMLHGYDGVRIAALPEMFSPIAGDALGWWIIQFQVTEKNATLKPQPINLDRKLCLQAPRQTVSANIMAGPGCEETLHWQLRSIQHAVDQIVIVDCGLSDEAKRIVAQYGQFGLKVVPGVDPKTHGFETPRNMGLEHCFGHWVLWIDTDEKMMQPHALHKYLRENIFDAYSIRQHHFAVDTTFTPDLPARLFRKRSGCKFFGMIHEHPEKGLNMGPGLSIVLPDVHIAHVGYLVESGRQQRFVRNFPMLQADQKKYPDRLLQKCIVMRDNMIRINYEYRQNGGRITEPMKEMAREVTTLYRKYFHGKSMFLASDPLDYYTQAMTILGEGIEVAFNLDAAKKGAHLNGGAVVARFKDGEEAEVEIVKRLRERTGPLTSVYF